jgi:hypothetical protein
MAVAEHQRFHGEVEFLAARGAYVGFRGLGGENRLFRPAHTVKDRRIAAEVAENPHPEVDLRGRIICAKSRHQAENGVGVQSIEFLEHGAWLRWVGLAL